jgi:hypothetical protein
MELKDWMPVVLGVVVVGAMFAVSFIINALGNFSEKSGTKISIDGGLIGTLAA